MTALLHALLWLFLISVLPPVVILIICIVGLWEALFR